MDDIKAWLCGPADYDTGVLLYNRFGINAALKRLFKEQWSAFKEDTLISALKDLYNANEPKNEATSAQQTVRVTPFNQFKHWPSDTGSDPVILALHQQWKPLFAEMMNLMHRVYDVAKQGEKNINKAIEAYQMAARILVLDDQIELIYAKRNFYYEHNRLPDNLEDPEQEEIIDPVKIAIELANNQRYVREYKVKLKKNPGHRSADKWAMLLKEKEKLVAKFKKRLNLGDE